MHIFGERPLGLVILILLAALVLIKKAASGSILKESPHGSAWLWLIHAFNLFFLLVVNPLAAILLIAGRLGAIDPTRVVITPPLLLRVVEISGALLYVTGYLFMAWALVGLERSYQVGGNAPRSSDRMVIEGPYRLVRHPMYTSALCISLGLMCLTQSIICFAVLCIYTVLIIRLIPFEEEGLRRAYGEQYTAYERKVKRLIPLVI